MSVASFDLPLALNMILFYNKPIEYLIKNMIYKTAAEHTVQ